MSNEWSNEKGARLKQLVNRRMESDPRMKTIDDLALHCEIHRTTLYNWFNDSHSPFRRKNIVRLVKWLGFNSVGEMERLLSGEDISQGVSLSEDELRLLEIIKMKGVAYKHEIARFFPKLISLEEAIINCLTKGCIAVRTLPNGLMALVLPGLGLISAVASGKRKPQAIANELGMPLKCLNSVCYDIRDRVTWTDGDEIVVKPIRPKAIVFDWSNTLVNEMDMDDSLCSFIAQKDNEYEFKILLDKLEKKSDWRWYDYEYLGKQFGITREEIAEQQKNDCSLIHFLPGVTTFLDRLSKSEVKIGLATNCMRSILETRASILGLDLGIFDHVLTLEQTQDPKSKEKLLEIFAQRTSLKPEQILLVSDSYERDILPGLILGYRTVWYQYNVERSSWGTPHMPLDNDAYTILRERLHSGNKTPNFISFHHKETEAIALGF